MVYFPHPSWPASILTWGWVKRAIEKPVSYQVSHLCGVVSMHLNGPVVQLPEVNTQPQAAIFFPAQDHCTSPWTVQLPDDTSIQHFLDMGPHVIIHVRRYTLVVLLEGCPVCYIYFMLDQSSFAQVQVTAHKQVFPFEQQFSSLFLLQFKPLLEALEIQGLQDPSLLGFVIGYPQKSLSEGLPVHLVGRGNLPQHSLCGNFHRLGT